MPLVSDEKSEFAKKWIDLCEYHLDGSGIADPIICYEYLGDFYVREGNKRVSVLRSYDATEISGNVTRLIPPLTDDPNIRDFILGQSFRHNRHKYWYQFKTEHKVPVSMCSALIRYSLINQ